MSRLVNQKTKVAMKFAFCVKNGTPFLAYYKIKVPLRRLNNITNMAVSLLSPSKKPYEVPSVKCVSLSNRSRILSGSLSFGSYGKAGDDITDNEYDEAF